MQLVEGTIFTPDNWPKDTWFQNRLLIVRLGIDVSLIEKGAIVFDKNGRGLIIEQGEIVYDSTE